MQDQALVLINIARVGGRSAYIAHIMLEKLEMPFLDHV